MAKKSPETIDEYIKAETPECQKALKQLRAIIHKAAPKAYEKLAWGMPTFAQEGNLVHFAAFKNHMSLFPGSEAIVHFKKQLGDRVTSKGTIQFSYDAKLPAALITRIVKYNLKQNLADAKAKAAKKKAKNKKTKKKK